MVYPPPPPHPKRALNEERLYKSVENPRNWRFLPRGGGEGGNAMLWTKRCYGHLGVSDSWGITIKPKKMAYSQNRCGPGISEDVMPWGYLENPNGGLANGGLARKAPIGPKRGTTLLSTPKLSRCWHVHLDVRLVDLVMAVALLSNNTGPCPLWRERQIHAYSSRRSNAEKFIHVQSALANVVRCILLVRSLALVNRITALSLVQYPLTQKYYLRIESNVLLQLLQDCKFHA